MIKSAILLARNTLKVTFKNKGSIVVLFVLPVLTILLAMLFYGSTTSKSTNIGIYNQDNSILSGDIIKSLGNSERFKIVALNGTLVNNKVASGEVDCGLIIPKGFEKSIYNNIPSKIQVLSIKGEETTAWISAYVNTYVKNLYDISLSSGGNEGLFKKMYASYKNYGMVLEVKKLTDSSTSKNITLCSLGFLLVFVLFTASSTSEFILKEKRNRTYHRICAAPVSGKSYVLGNVFANLFILFVQMLIMLTAASTIFGINTYVPIYQLLLILMCFGLVAIALTMAVVSFSKDSLQASTLSNLIITPTCMLGGCFWSINLMPKYMQRISDFTPQKWTLETIQKLQTGSGLSSVLIQIAILLAFASAFFLIAVYKFNKTNDVKTFI